MTINITVEDGETGQTAAVNDNRAVRTSTVFPELAPFGTQNRLRFLSQLLDATGDGTGSTDQAVDGSSTNSSFFLRSSETYDIFVTNLIILLSDSSVTMEKFGDITALTNGWDLCSSEAGENNFFFSSVKTCGDIYANSGIFHNFIDSSKAQVLAKRTATTGALIVNLPLAQIIPFGVRIGRGSTDLIEATVKDDLTGLTEFTVRAIGFKQFS